MNIIEALIRAEMMSKYAGTIFKSAAQEVISTELQTVKDPHHVIELVTKRMLEMSTEVRDTVKAAEANENDPLYDLVKKIKGTDSSSNPASTTE